MSVGNAVLAEPKQGRESPPQSLHDRLMATRCLSSELARPLSDEDQVVQAMDDASPTKWHLAHTTWFFEAFLLKRFLAGYRVFDEAFEYCFNSYYESVGPRHPRPKRGLLTRPSAETVRDYRDYVDEALGRLFAGGPQAEAAELIELGINHEQPSGASDHRHSEPVRRRAAEARLPGGEPGRRGARGRAAYLHFI
jgi:hypothetical protein